MLQIDGDTNHTLSAKFGIRSFPTFICLKQGQVIQTVNGADPNSLQQMIVTHGKPVMNDLTISPPFRAFTD